jgi:Right handed beta helix region
MLSAAQIKTIRDNDPGVVLPGIDTMTGNPYAPSTLLDLTKITQNTHAPFYYVPSSNTVFVMQSGIVLRGINFGDAAVILDANNVTVEDCNFSSTLRQNGVGAIVKNNTFIGVKDPTGSWGGFISSNPDITIEDNTLLDAPSDAIDIGGLVPTPTGAISPPAGGLITGNYFSGAGLELAAHADAIWVTASTVPMTITDNLIDGTWNPNNPAQPNSAIRITNEEGNVANVTIADNYLMGAGFTLEVIPQGPPNYTITNVSITNNDVGFSVFGTYYPNTTNNATVTGTKAVDFSDPTDSTQALAAYVPPTAQVVIPGGAENGSTPMTILGNGIASQGLGSNGQETIFVGGLGPQILFGLQATNILTYLALGDGGDRMSAFDPAKDVIDLSHIDADILTAGKQSFTFIGTASFAGGAEVRYQLNPTNATTTVQATLAGDTTADFTITLAGLRPLTAANFALTSAQSTAALANGAALSYKKVTTAAGAPTEYAYSNVQGAAYTSYESFYGATYEDLAADDLNLSSNANKLVLYDPSQTVTRGGGSESLQEVGMGSDPLAYHATETIDATTSGGEQFIFSAGFGKETINGFSVSGTTPDSIQLAKAAFSYLTPGMTQAEDLAAVMSQATRSAFGLTIADSHGDRLTLMGVTPSLVAANPGVLAFT